MWQPLRRAVDQASIRYADMRDNHTVLDRLADSRKLPERLTDLRQQAAALDAWRHWAFGGNITANGAAWAVEILQSVQDPHHQALATSLASIDAELVARPDCPELDIDLAVKVEDLGIDFDF